MLSKCISANSGIMQVVWQKIPLRRTATEKIRQAVVLSQQRRTTGSRRLADQSTR